MNEFTQTCMHMHTRAHTHTTFHVWQINRSMNLATKCVLCPMSSPTAVGDLSKENVFVEWWSALHACIAVHHSFPLLAQRQRQVPCRDCASRLVMIHSFHPELKHKSVEWWWAPSNHGRQVHSTVVQSEWLISQSLHITRLCLTVPHHLLDCAGNRQ